MASQQSLGSILLTTLPQQGLSHTIPVAGAPAWGSSSIPRVFADKRPTRSGLIVRRMTDRSTSNGEESARPSPGDTLRGLAELYEAYAPGLYRYALMVLADPFAAEDAVEQVFTKIAGMGERIVEIGDQNSYLRKAVRNECYRIIRRTRARNETDLTSAPLLETPAGTKDDGEQRRTVERALRSLPPEQREVVHMKVYENMTFKQIARVLDVPINTAASRYRYALDKLGRLIQRCGRSGHQ